MPGGRTTIREDFVKELTARRPVVTFSFPHSTSMGKSEPGICVNSSMFAGSTITVDCLD